METCYECSMVDKLISQVSSYSIGSQQKQQQQQQTNKKGSATLQTPTGISDLCYLPIQTEELNKMAKVCIGNSVYVQKLKQKVGSKDADNTGATTKIVTDLETNRWFCTIKIS